MNVIVTYGLCSLCPEILLLRLLITMKNLFYKTSMIDQVGNFEI